MNSRDTLQDIRAGFILIMSGYRKNCKCELYYYKNNYKTNTEGQEMEIYHIFVVLMGSTKITEELYIQACNDSVAPTIKKKGKVWFGSWRSY